MRINKKFQNFWYGTLYYYNIKFYRYFSTLMENSTYSEIIIIGAGPAGIGASREL